ncbi:isochorismatase family protein [Texcoconibacillus texcoconensis]|uniref:Nicotinamidase-related amidase n=1 Tax=Texcoconibacillus texcoconensis TaxID=1095777 RepID=A0A840QQH5_9BACI|nr:nicotinamidase-related amidase [Texcoconibacillus texcoconensis]
MKALIVIDYTNDFVSNDGKLTTKEAGQSIEKRIDELCRLFAETDDYIVFAIDVHDENDPYHPESDLFPPHNIRGTKGRQLYRGLTDTYAFLQRSHPLSTLWLDKTRYSAFAGTNLEIKLRERNINEIHLVGVCTDICVLHTAIDAYNKGFSIVIHRDAVQSFDATGHEWALKHFSDTLGARVIERGVDIHP